MSAYDNQRWNNFYDARDKKRGRSSSAPTYLGDSNVSADIQKQNAIVLMWVPKVRTQLKSSARWFSDGKSESFVIRGAGSKRHTEFKLAQSLKSHTRQHYGEVDTVTFSFERHGVFVHKGVGRGYPIRGGSVIKNPSGKTRVAVEWFSPVLDTNIPELANRIANVNADAALNTARMMIK